MLINCYYYAPHNHTLLRRHQQADLEHMVEMGTDIVSVCVGDDQLTNWHQARLRNVVEMGHDLGLKVHAVPNRWGGIVAGWLDGFSGWILEHKDIWYPDMEPGRCDPRYPAMRQRFEELLKLTLDFGFDGVIWDEPRPPRQEVIDFLDEMSAYAKSLKPEVVISMFANSPNLQLAEPFAGTKHMDYLGSDGHVRSEEHQMHRMKTTIFRAYDVFDPVLRAAGKKTFYLLEGQRHRDPDLQTYLDNIEKAFNLPMDHLMYYYSAHEMSLKNEDIFNRVTWEQVKLARARHPRR